MQTQTHTHAERNSAAQKLAASIDQAIENLAQLTNESFCSEMMALYLSTLAKFHHYSLSNQFLIQLQRPGAEIVAGYKAWQQHKRQVKRGEKGIAILAPCTYKTEDDAGNVSYTLAGFRTAYVFDVSQTEGEPIPTIEWRSPAQSALLRAGLDQYAAANQIPVAIAPLPGNTQGECSAKGITLAPASGIKTYIHELAHWRLNHLEDRLDRRTAEIEAEAVAYAVCLHFDLPDLQSPNYLALHAATADLIRARLNRIRGLVVEIIQSVQPQEINT